MASRIPEDAFEFYVALGPGRSHQAVADHYSVSKRGVTKHAVKEGWADRLDKIEAEAREKTDKRLVETVEEMRTRHLKMLRVIAGRALNAIKQYPLTSGMDGVRAAELVIKMQRLVIGEPSERTAVSVEQVTRREMETLLAVPDDEPGDDDDW